MWPLQGRRGGGGGGGGGGRCTPRPHGLCPTPSTPEKSQGSIKNVETKILRKKSLEKRFEKQILEIKFWKKKNLK